MQVALESAPVRARLAGSSCRGNSTSWKPQHCSGPRVPPSITDSERETGGSSHET
jgi:hypothetical protein